jgi:extradiol dioxygenase family protein
MALTKLDHFLVQTEDMEGTRDWYARVLGMTAGYTPDFKFPVSWMYLGKQDVLHITEGGKNVSENRKAYVGQQSTDTSGSGVIDHIAFRAEGLKDMIDHLESLNIDFKQRQVSDQGLYQLFMFDPNGIKVELNYENSEAADIEPELRASDLADGQ